MSVETTIQQHPAEGAQVNSNQYQEGFPRRLLPLVRCTRDGGELTLRDDHSGDADFVYAGRLACESCGRECAIDDGILILLEQDALDAQSRDEQGKRNAERKTHGVLLSAAAQANSDMEMLPVMEEVRAAPGRTILEVGCGEGRYTVVLANEADVIAMDFSIRLLRVLQRRLPAGTTTVGLVLADVSTAKVSHGQFDAVLSTLTSNLPTPQHREKLYDLARLALRPKGRFVFCSHLQGIRQWLSGEKKSARYYVGGIYRYHFGLRESVAEASPFFERVRVRPIQIYLPLARTLRLPIVRLSRMFERVPGFNMFGSLLVGVAEMPRATVKA